MVEPVRKADTILQRARAAQEALKRRCEEESRLEQQRKNREDAWAALRFCDKVSLPEKAVEFTATVDPWPKLNAAKLLKKKGTEQDALAYSLHVLKVANESGDPAAVKRELDKAAAEGDVFFGLVEKWLRYETPELVLHALYLKRMGLPLYKKGPATGGNAGRDQGGTRQGEGGKPGNNRPKRIPRAEAEILVRDWLRKNAKQNPASITRDAVAAGARVSTGMVSKTAAWKAFRERRDAEAKPGAREVPLTETMQAVIPADCARPDELPALIEEQEAERAKELRPHKRRHKPS
jgi:hypothetical protein